MTDDVWERIQVIHAVTCELAELQRLGKARALAPGPARRAMEREIEVIGEACRQIDSTDPAFARELEQRLPDVDWASWRGARNHLAHNLWNIKHELLWAAVGWDGPALRSALERAFGPGIAGRRSEPHVETARNVRPARRAASMPPVAMDEDDRAHLRFMRDLTGELRPLAALGPRTVTEPGIPRRAAERDVELIGQAWIQLQTRSPDLARQVPVDGRRWRDLRNALAKNLVHPDPHTCGVPWPRMPPGCAPASPPPPGGSGSSLARPPFRAAAVRPAGWAAARSGTDRYVPARNSRIARLGSTDWSCGVTVAVGPRTSRCASRHTNGLQRH